MRKKSHGVSSSPEEAYVAEKRGRGKSRAPSVAEIKVGESLVGDIRI